jgi:hypothetical protein
MFWIALAAHINMPFMDQASIWTLFSADDVPLDVVPDGESRRVNVRVVVKPDGAIQNCGAEFSSGIPKLDAYTCAIILRRARFHPAIGLDGLPAYGVIRTAVTWAVNDAPSKWPTDLDLTVTALPKGIKNPAFVSLMFAVDETGRPSSCAAEEPRPPAHRKLTDELIQVACDQLLNNYVAIPARDIAGKTVRSVQDANVRFSTDRQR